MEGNSKIPINHCQLQSAECAALTALVSKKQGKIVGHENLALGASSFVCKGAL